MNKLFWQYNGHATSSDPRFNPKEFHQRKMESLIELINKHFVGNEEQKLILNCGQTAYKVLKEALLASGYSIRDSERWTMHIVPSFDDNVIQFYDNELTISNEPYGDIPFYFYSPFAEDALVKLSKLLYEETRQGNLEVALSLCEVLKGKIQEKT